MKRIEEMSKQEFVQIFAKNRIPTKKIEAFLESIGHDPKASPLALITALAESTVKHSFCGHERTDEEHVREGLEAVAEVIVGYGLALRNMLAPEWDKYIKNEADEKGDQPCQ